MEMIFKIRIHVCHSGQEFSNLVFLCVALCESMCIFAFGLSLSPSNSFPNLLIFSTFLLLSLRCHILFQNCFCFLVIRLLVYLGAIFPNALVNLFCCFGIYFLFCIVLPCLDIFLVFLLCQHLLINFLKLYCLFYLCYVFLFVPACSSVFPLFYHYFMLVLRICFTWSCFIKVWETWSLPRNPGLFWEFKTILTVSKPRWSRVFFWFPIELIYFPGFWGPFQAHQHSFLSLTSSYFTVSSTLRQDPTICLSFRFLLFLIYSLLECQNPLLNEFFSYQIILALVFWLGLDLYLTSQRIWRRLACQIEFISMEKFSSLLQFQVEYQWHPFVINTTIYYYFHYYDLAYASFLH